MPTNEENSQHCSKGVNVYKYDLQFNEELNIFKKKIQLVSCLTDHKIETSQDIDINTVISLTYKDASLDIKDLHRGSYETDRDYAVNDFTLLVIYSSPEGHKCVGDVLLLNHHIKRIPEPPYGQDWGFGYYDWIHLHDLGNWVLSDLIYVYDASVFLRYVNNLSGVYTDDLRDYTRSLIEPIKSVLGEKSLQCPV